MRVSGAMARRVLSSEEPSLMGLKRLEDIANWIVVYVFFEMRIKVEETQTG